MNREGEDAIKKLKDILEVYERSFYRSKRFFRRIKGGEKS